MINKEEEKKTISEYVQLFSTATKQRKSKNTKLALSTYTQCLDMISKINNIEKICESNFFIAQCAFKLNDIEKSKSEIIISRDGIHSLSLQKTLRSKNINEKPEKHVTILIKSGKRK